MLRLVGDVSFGNQTWAGPLFQVAGTGITCRFSCYFEIQYSIDDSIMQSTAMVTHSTAMVGVHCSPIHSKLLKRYLLLRPFLLGWPWWQWWCHETGAHDEVRHILSLLEKALTPRQDQDLRYLHGILFFLG